jgi:amino acid adenylation domain-containing protein
MAHAGIRDAEAFFRAKLGDVDEPTAPFGILDVRGEGSGMLDARELLDPDVALRLRARAKRSNVTPATLFHAAWALVVSRTSNRDDVVYGTVLLGRLNGHTDIQRTLGMFINTLPLRLRLKDISAKALVEQTQRELAELLDQEQAPLAAAQRCSGIAGSAPLFTTLLNYLHGAADLEAEFASEDVEILASQGGSNYPVSLSVNDRGQDFELAIEADRRIDAQRLLGYLQTTTRNLVAALEEAPDTLALSLPMIPADERRQIVESFNATSAPFPRESLIHELFEEQVERTPAATAVVDGEQALTYAALNERANKLAHYLIARGLQAGEYVPILMARSLDMLIAQLAVLKGGAVYVPMDPTLPVERQLFMTRDCGAHRIIAAGAPSSARHSEHIEWVDPSALGDVLERQPSRNVSRAMATVPPAYVMYTSGSTGTPKGVIVPHRAVNRLAINNGYAQIGAGDCIAHHSNPAFDASTFEVWGALLNGATVVIVSQPILLDAASLAGLLKRERVTLLYMSVGLFNQHAEALADAFRQLRYLMVGGDALDAGVIRQVLREGRPRHLLNVYGPTECTTFSTRYVIDRVEEGVTSIPIGQPISNAQIYILDSFRQPVPLGATGEIYIGGAGVADGYLNRPELTAERFLPDPFSNDAHARLYRTGDLGRWRADGAVEFLGRTDFQVKIRGYRIELGEIDARLMECEDVRDAVVIARADGSGEKQLVAYFVSRRQNDESMEAVRTHLKAVLPQYMVPSALVRLQQLPLTPTGKVDRRALPAPDLASYASQQYEPPRGEVEETVAAIWQELLGVARVGRQDNFFELGGHSLQGMKLIGRVAEKLRVRLLATAVFRHPTVRELAVAIEAQRAAGSGYDGLEATEIEEGTI